MPFAPNTYFFLRAASVAVKSVRYVIDELSGELEEEWVQSTCIASASYNKITNTLRITFTDGSRYKYLDCSQSYYDTLKDAMSKGQAFNFNVRNEGLVYRREG